MGVRASGFDIYSTTDTRGGCWVAFHPCRHDTHEPLPTQRIHNSIPDMTFPQNWGGIQCCFLNVAAPQTLKAIQQYCNLLIGVFSSPFSGSFILWLHQTCYINAKLHTIACSAENCQWIRMRVILYCVYVRYAGYDVC